ncbi:hypothetical protein BsWGS_17318 [Bradybaena similaris]
MPKKCCVPECRSNYDSTREYVTVFKFPSDSVMRETWKKCIPRKNWTPTKSAVVCRKHFRPCDMILSDTITDDNGVQRQRPRKNPVLRPNAYPCLFSGRPPVYLPVPAPQSQKGLGKSAAEVVKTVIAEIKDGKLPLQGHSDTSLKLPDSASGDGSASTSSAASDTKQALAPGQVTDSSVLNQKSEASSQDIRQFTSIPVSAVSQVPVVVTGLFNGQDISLDVSQILFGTAAAAQMTAISTIVLAVTTQENPNAMNKSVVESDTSQKAIETVDSGMYSCPHCSAVLSHRSMLYKHISKVHSNSSSEEGGASVVVCAEHSDKPVNTEGRQESDENNRLECVKSENSKDITELTEISSQKLIHKNSSLSNLHSKNGNSNKKTFKCEFCIAAFDDSSKLKAHTSKHTGVKPFYCGVCGAGFTVTENLRIHMRKHTGEKPFVCGDCGDRFVSNKRLKIHRTAHTGEKPYKCDVCGLDFNEAYSLQAHMVKHTGVKPYQCEVCGVGFTFKSYMYTHMRKHTGEKPYACDDCGDRFVNKRQLKVHRISHTGEKPYKCDECGAGFNQAFTLQLHKKKHTGDKSYKYDRGQKHECEICGQQFSSHSGLWQHKKRHTGGKPYKCDVCGVAFAVKISLINHERKHTGETPYSCEICGLRFSVISSLQNHQRKHTGEKPHVCDICGTKFAFKGSLRDHKRLHTGEKPYKCDLCCADFSNPKKLKRHKKVHAGESGASG